MTNSTQPHSSAHDSSPDMDTGNTPSFSRSMYNNSPTVAEYMSMLLSDDENHDDNDIAGDNQLYHDGSSPKPLTRAMRAMSDSQAPGRRIYHGDVAIVCSIIVC